MKEKTYLILCFLIGALCLFFPYQETLAQKTKKKSSRAASHPKKHSIRRAQPKPQTTQPPPDKTPAAAVAPDNIKEDPALPKSVQVVSTFKPSLKIADKIYFSATNTSSDETIIPTLSYNVPTPTVYLPYTPTILPPHYLQTDSAVRKQTEGYLKLGYGNYNTLVAEFGLLFKDQHNTMYGLSGEYLGFTGNLPFQQFSKASTKASYIKQGSLHEFNAAIGLGNQTQYFYGLGVSPTTDKNVLLQSINNLSVEVALKNQRSNTRSINYHPSLQLLLTNNGNRKGTEYSVVASLPLSKGLGDHHAFHLNSLVDYSSFTNSANAHIANNLFVLSPYYEFKNRSVAIELGASPSISQSTFALLPHLNFKYNIQTNITLQAGWKGYYQKNTYKSLTTENPFIAQPDALSNTRFNEVFVGLKTIIRNRLSVDGTLSHLTITNLQIFDNNPSLPRNFYNYYIPNLNAIKLQAEAVLSFQEKLVWFGSISYFNYYNLSVYPKPFGLLPIKLQSTLTWHIFPKLSLGGNLFTWQGAAFQGTALNSFSLKNVIDLNLEAHYKLTPSLVTWFHLNNIFNTAYQRWNGYNVLGFNVAAGLRYNFGK